MKRKIPFGEWDRTTLDIHSKNSKSAVRLRDGRTLEAYAGYVPNEWDGTFLDVFDCFEIEKLKEFHPEVLWKLRLS